VSVYPIAARQQLGKRVPAATRNIGGVVFCAVHVVSKGSVVAVQYDEK
jgi:hypothetical protein